MPAPHAAHSASPVTSTLGRIMKSIYLIAGVISIVVGSAIICGVIYELLTNQFQLSFLNIISLPGLIAFFLVGQLWINKANVIKGMQNPNEKVTATIK